MKKIAVHSLLLLIILGSGRLQAVAGPADKIRKISNAISTTISVEKRLYMKSTSHSVFSKHRPTANWYGKPGKQPTMSWTKKS